MNRKTMTAKQQRQARNNEVPDRRRSPRRPENRPQAWEPVPLHIPAPQEPSLEAPRREKSTVRIDDIAEPRGVVIIDYGD